MNTLPLYFAQYVALLFAICVHESLHAYAADRCGDPTARLAGRITLNPLPHIDPIGSVLFPLMAIVMSGFGGRAFLIGWAKPVPVNPRNFRNPRRDDIIVSLAGVAGNFSLAVGVALLYRVLGVLGVTSLPEPVHFLLGMMMMINVVLGVFNLIPLPPLDGSHVLEHFLPPDAALKYRRIAPFSFLILIVLLWSGILRQLLFLPMILIYTLAGPLAFPT